MIKTEAKANIDQVHEYFMACLAEWSEFYDVPENHISDIVTYVMKKWEAEADKLNDSSFISFIFSEIVLLLRKRKDLLKGTNVESEKVEDVINASAHTINMEDIFGEPSERSNEKQFVETVEEKKMGEKKKPEKEPQKFLDFKGKIIDVKKKFRRFCFVWNNYPEDYKTRLNDLKPRYLIAGREVCPTTGTPHIQGYIEFKEQLRIAEFARKVWAHTCTIPGARGTGISKFSPAESDQEKNINYCSKEDVDAYEIGERDITRGVRSDLKAIKKLVEDGVAMKEICKNAGSLNDVKFAEKYLSYCDKARSVKSQMNIVWIYGNTGTGKTFDAISKYPNAYVKGPNTLKWFDGYDGQTEMIIEEFRDCMVKFSELLAILQPVEYRVEYKGGSRQLRATTIIITTCFSPIEVYNGVEEVRDQLYRRIDRLEFYKSREERKYVELSDYSVATRCRLVKEFSAKYKTSERRENIIDKEFVRIDDIICDK